MSPKDLCTIELLDKIINSGVSVLKIEGRARSAEYVKKVTSVYRRGADAYLDGSYTEDLTKRLKGELEEVFNRGFWDGYYQDAKLGEWSDIYGNKAKKKKSYAGRVTNYFSKISVAEILVEARDISIGDELLVIGSTSGVVEHAIKEIRVDLKLVDTAKKGEYCSIPIPEKIRRSDKVYVLLNVEDD